MADHFLSKMMPPMFYVLDAARKPVPVDEVVEWGAWLMAAMESGERIVGYTVIVGEVVVSTVFLGWDASFLSGTPHCFETVVFDAEGEPYTRRYRTWEEAEAGHRLVVARCCDDMGIARHLTLDIEPSHVVAFIHSGVN